MIDRKVIDRINELARKSKNEGLTPAEQAEQQKLRKQYIAAWKKSLVAELENTYILRPDGTKEKLKKKN